MIRGLYTAAAGMLAGLMRQETIIHNLANVRTVGYKADYPTLADFPSLLLNRINGETNGPEVGKAGTGISLSGLTTDYGDGAVKNTDNPLDFAIVGEGFFQVETPDGVRFTRDGQFRRDSTGRLVDGQGNPVLGDNGPITLGEGPVTVTPQGNIYINEKLTARLSIASFEDKANLVKDGETRFESRGAAPTLLEVNQTKVYQGYIEDSNTNTAQAMTEMMSVMRTYQACSKMVEMQDAITEQAVNVVGRV
jgi:flagellar basal-body rod protein FlgF